MGEMLLKGIIFALFIQVVISYTNNRPIIGVLDQPNDDPYLAPYGQTYIPASYVKWLESAGAQVVPVPYNADQTVLQKLFNSLNGILFTGGGLDLEPNTTYYQTANFFFQSAAQANANGDYWPIWGT